jgi:hypothetical protein
MAAGVLHIRVSGGDWNDAYTTWGVTLTDNSLSQLMTPAPNKAPVENMSRLEHGKRVVTDGKYVKKDERNITMEMHLIAKSKTEFWTRYNAFCTDVLDKGFFDMKCSYCQGKVFHLIYESCTQFSEFMEELAKFTLRLNEPNPANRT